MKRVIGGAIVAATCLTAPALASEGYRVGSVLSEQELVYAPRGFQNMCEQRPELCVEVGVGAEVNHVMNALGRQYGARALAPDAPELTPERLETLQRVNVAVNEMIHPMEDTNGDVWSLSSVQGDCEEYVLMKREVLARLGWPRTAMRISVVRNAGDYPYHAVLVVTTRGGEFVLDNLTNQLTRVEDSPYEFVVAQSFFQPGTWVRVRAIQ